MAKEFKPLRFFLLVALMVFFASGMTAFYTDRAAQGRTPEERAGYAIGAKAGEEASRTAKLPSAAELNIMAQERFKKQGSGNQQGLGSRLRKGL